MTGAARRLPVALGRDSRFLECLTLGLWQANCYLLGDRALGTAIVVDPGQDGAPAVRERLAAREVRCEAVVLTHGHLDHLWSAPAMAAELDVPVYLHPHDRWLWDDPAAAFGLPREALEAQLGLRWRPPPVRLETLADAAVLELCGVRLTVRHTPGHTPGSCVLLAALAGCGHEPAPAPLLFSGDLLFAGAVGRTDFPRGSARQQAASLGALLPGLDERTMVLPGHGPPTTVAAELAANPFVRQVV